MNVYHFQLSGGIGDGSFTLSQQCADDGLAIAQAATLMRRSRIAQAATRMTVWRGEFGPKAECVAVYEISPSVEFERNAAIESQHKAMRTPR
jgi:hypothetical protein